MEKKQVISRMSSESYERLQELSKKYGVSSSGLIALLVNEKWLKEKELAVKALENPKEENQNSARTSKSRRRHKSSKR